MNDQPNLELYETEEDHDPSANGKSKDKFLSEVDLLRVEMSQFRLQHAASLLREKRLEDRMDDVNTANAQLNLQVKAHELTIARLTKVKEFEEKTKKLSKEHERAGELHESLKTELAKKYEISDWGQVAYDDVSGKITVIPVPIKEK